MLLGLTTTAFANGTAVLNILPTLSGLYGVARPASALGVLGFPIPAGPPEAQKLSLSMTRMYGVRQATMGLASLALWWSGEHRLMGVLMLVNTPVAIVDGFVSRWQVGGGEWGHWGFIPLGLVLTIGLLRAPPGS
ncbi:hypothetical protein Daus18300_009859 [Diaporthe australafricana]|uniref:DUF4267 domain-containing protein n=1 Tax=Diaporthe australafricana TaxID=127596 RepID=A0ABR3WCY1_9PEZI